MGLQNIGVKAFIAEKLPALRTLGTPVFANVFGYAVEDYTEVLRALEDAEGIIGYELNVSCPNTAHGGMFFSNDPVLLTEVVTAARSGRPAAVDRQVVAQRGADRTDCSRGCRTLAGADAISLVNTFISLAIDAHTRKPRLGNGFGGLSGPAIKPIALRMVYEAAQAVKIPVIGLGGIATGIDAAEFLIAGASAVEVGTASFWDPQAPARIAEELDAFLASEKIARVQDLTGSIDFSKPKTFFETEEFFGIDEGEHMKQIVSTEQAPKAIGPYSQAVISNGWAFLSGQIPLDPATGEDCGRRHRGANRPRIRKP